jgi:hypothetical protein
LGLCDKPKIKCGDCPNRAFLPLDDRALLVDRVLCERLRIKPPVPYEEYFSWCRRQDDPSQKPVVLRLPGSRPTLEEVIWAAKELKLELDYDPDEEDEQDEDGD